MINTFNMREVERDLQPLNQLRLGFFFLFSSSSLRNERVFFVHFHVEGFSYTSMFVSLLLFSSSSVECLMLA